MIIRMNHESGAQMETTVPDPHDVTPAEVAAGVLMVLPGVTRVRIWTSGRSFLDEPDADASRVQGAPVDDDLQASHDAYVADVATILDLEAGLEAIADTPTPEPPGWITDWRSASVNDSTVPPWRSAHYGDTPPV
ncbi:hypothetical protein [Pseudofrankia sp. BMG5.37]|uniref:hypothetical protein n=1 Tax=Pseudofrankia sp. BMG5.37 TaxID=3050035 RepID=UPI0028952FEE|nr:hypothetical protein [Pseudofrankia sp. BMG5.37]MDT3441766.1 hypothetical protein [Pseudofrankia sp. BMG5.37]